MGIFYLRMFPKLNKGEINMLKFKDNKLTIDFEEGGRLLKKGAKKAVELTKDVANKIEKKLDEEDKGEDDTQAYASFFDEPSDSDLFRSEDLEFSEQEQREIEKLISFRMMKDRTREKRKLDYELESNAELVHTLKQSAKELAARGIYSAKDLMNEARTKAELGFEELLQYKDEKFEELFKGEIEPDDIEEFPELDDEQAGASYVESISVSPGVISVTVDTSVTPDVDREVEVIKGAINHIAAHISGFEEYANFARALQHADVRFIDKDSDTEVRFVDGVTKTVSSGGPVGHTNITEGDWEMLFDNNDPRHRIASEVSSHEIPLDADTLITKIKYSHPDLSDARMKSIFHLMCKVNGVPIENYLLRIEHAVRSAVRSYACNASPEVQIVNQAGEVLTTVHANPETTAARLTKYL